VLTQGLVWLRRSTMGLDMRRATTIKAPAKINLSLQVLGERPDGYHEIASVMAAVDLCDELRVADRPDGGVEFVCDDPRIPLNGRNLVCRAADLLGQLPTIQPAIRIELDKCIPAGAGLGGGSSDAAAALLVLVERWGLKLADGELVRLAGQLGSDVPFFLTCGTAVVTGRGEQVNLLNWRPPGWVLLIMPELEIRTAEVYAAWQGRDSRAGASGPWWQKPPTSVGELDRCCFNDLQPAAERVEPTLKQIRRELTDMGLGTVHLSGSGSAMFVLVEDVEQAHRWAEQVRQRLKVATYVGRYFGTR